MAKINKIIIIISLIISALIFLFFVMPGLYKPVIGWQIFTWQLAENIASGNVKAINSGFDFSLYAYLLAFSFKIFGIGELGAHFIGLLCIFMMPLIIYFISNEIAEKDIRLPVFLIGIALFITSPAVIQGALVIDKADTNLFVMLISLFYLFLFKTEGRPLWQRVLVLGCVYCLCLFAKITTSLACLFSVPLAYFLSRNYKKGFSLFLCLLIAIAFFIVIWTVFCYYVVGIHRFFEPLFFYAGAASATLFSFNVEKFKTIALDIFRITLWFSPFLLILSLLAILDSVKKIFTRTAVVLPYRNFCL